MGWRKKIFKNKVNNCIDKLSKECPLNQLIETYNLHLNISIILNVHKSFHTIFLFLHITHIQLEKLNKEIRH